MNKTERHVYQLLDSISIHHPEQLSISTVSELINIPVKYWGFSSEAVRYKEKYKIFIDERISEQKKWQEFGHELFHVIGHEYCQNKRMHTTYYQLQENQANYFSYHFCVPTFMLDNLMEVSIYEIMNQFNVEYEFAIRRYEMYENKQYGRMISGAM